MLQSFLPNSHIQLIPSIDSWQEALDLCAKPLLDESLIEQRYITRIKKLHQEIGAYFVIAPQIAMPHARPEDGVLEQSASLLIVKNGVNFESNNDPVNIILLFSAKDNESHLNMLSQVAELFGNAEDVAKISNATTIEQVVDIIKKY